MGSTKRTNIFTIVEETSDMTLFDCRWVPSSTRIVVAGTDTKGHGILRVYTMVHSLPNRKLSHGCPDWNEHQTSTKRMRFTIIESLFCIEISYKMFKYILRGASRAVRGGRNDLTPQNQIRKTR